MTKKITIIIALVVVVGAGLAFLLSQSPKDQSAQNNNPKGKTAKAQEVDKIKVYYFHTTNRCMSCKTLEKYTFDTLKKFFQPQLNSGKIEFRAINVDLPENKKIARKYGASGSSLFINQVIDGEDNIEQNTRVWRLLRNKAQFQNYLKNEINSYLN